MFNPVEDRIWKVGALARLRSGLRVHKRLTGEVGVVKNWGRMVRTTLITEHHHRLLVNLCVGVLAAHGLDGDGSGSAGLGRLLFLGPPGSSLGLQSSAPGLCWMGHASWAALILCLLVKGQNMRLPNKI